MEPHQFNYSMGIMVPGGKDLRPYMLSTVLDSKARISCVSETTICALQKRFPRVDMVRPYDSEQHQIVLADGRAVPIEWQTCTLTATIMMPWVPVAIWLALAVMPGEDDLLILGSRTLREKLIIDVMNQLRDTATASGGGASTTEKAPAKVPPMKPGVIGVRRVVVTMEVMQQAAGIEVEAAGETDRFKDMLLDRGSKMMTGFDDNEMQQREQALENAILVPAQAGIPPDDVAKLRHLVLGRYKEAFRRRLTDEPRAQVKPMRMVWTSTVQITKAKTRLYAPKKRARSSKQMQMLKRVHMVYLNPQATFVSIAMALPKGDTYRMVANYRAAND